MNLLLLPGTHRCNMEIHRLNPYPSMRRRRQGAQIHPRLVDPYTLSAPVLYIMDDVSFLMLCGVLRLFGLTKGTVSYIISPA